MTKQCTYNDRFVFLIFQGFVAPSFDDRMLEVVAVLGASQMGMSKVFGGMQHHRIAQVWIKSLFRNTNIPWNCVSHEEKELYTNFLAKLKVFLYSIIIWYIHQVSLYIVNYINKIRLKLLAF